METLPKQPITANLHEGWISMSPNKKINREVGWSIVLSVLMMPAGIVAIISLLISGVARLMICRTTRCVANVFQGELNEPARGR